MTNCSKCGVPQPEGAKFCAECGAPLQKASLQIVADHSQARFVEVKKEAQQKTKKKPLLRRRWIWVLLIVVIIAAVRKQGRQATLKTVRLQTEPIAEQRPM